MKPDPLKRLFCPYDDCDHSQKGDGKSFASKGHLNQHILNRHEGKSWRCDGCEGTFAAEWQLKKHKAVCLIKEWQCPTCKFKYDKRKSLLVHCRRHKHPAPPGALLRSTSNSDPVRNDATNEPSALKLQRIIVLKNPVLSNANQVPKSPDQINKSTVTLQSNETQTDIDCATCSHCSDSSSSNKRPKIANGSFKNQAGTQTDPSQSRASTSAQCPPMRSAKKLKSNRPAESIETQTETFELRSTTKANRAEAETITDQLPLLNHHQNPLLSQMTAPRPPTFNHEHQSVQTDAHDSLPPTFKGTQTDHWGQMMAEDLFMDASINESGTQTIWNNEITTQTDETLSLDLSDFLLSA